MIFLKIYKDMNKEFSKVREQYSERNIEKETIRGRVNSHLKSDRIEH